MIPQTNSIEVMLNTILTNQQAHVRNMNHMVAQVAFLARNLDNSGVPLPPGYFGDNDDGNI